MEWQQIYTVDPSKNAPKQDVTIPESAENLLWAKVRYLRDRAAMANAEVDGVAYRWQSNGIMEAYCLLTGCCRDETEERYARNKYGGAASEPVSQNSGRICKDCGTKLDDYEGCPANIGTDDECHQCFSCHCTSMENGELTQCDSCGAYFSGSHLLTNPQNGEREICPYCSDVWCN